MEPTAGKTGAVDKSSLDDITEGANKESVNRVNPRVLAIGNKEFTQVECMDLPGLGNACHKYRVIPTRTYGKVIFAEVNFQNGPVKEEGVNGCHNEDLIAIVLDRLAGFQQGDYACEANMNAINDLRSALSNLNARTKERQRRGVEGTSEK